ncbi:hypothetical protein AGR5A_pb0092 [Agrobacterium genomosp. 5 str. CFBP 6626]|nr:hypothetical protein AGR5A_pb0092 [Agrobacterium genomosp. 5 str. CFBP 6626]
MAPANGGFIHTYFERLSDNLSNT